MPESFSQNPSPQTRICKLWRLQPKKSTKKKTWGVDTGLPLNTVFGDYGRLYNCDASMFGGVIKGGGFCRGSPQTSRTLHDLPGPPNFWSLRTACRLKTKKKLQGIFCEETNMEHVKLVGGWTNPFEKFESKWPSSPNFRGENFKNIWKNTT